MSQVDQTVRVSSFGLSHQCGCDRLVSLGNAGVLALAPFRIWLQDDFCCVMSYGLHYYYGSILDDRMRN